MNEYMNRKLGLYGQPLKFLKAYKVATILLLVFLCIRILFSLFDISSLDINFSFTILLLTLGILSLYSLPLLDKLSFFTTLSFAGVLLVQIVSAVIALFAFASPTPMMQMEGNMRLQGYSMDSIGGGMGGSMGGSMDSNISSATSPILPWISIIILVSIAVPIILFVIQVIKHKRLFFTSVEQLIEVSDEE